MALSIKDQAVAAIKALVAAATDSDGHTLFQTCKRGYPQQQTLTEAQKPAAFIVTVRDTPTPAQQQAEYEINDLILGVICVGIQKDVETIDAEMNDLEGRVKKALEQQIVGADSFPVTWRATETPMTAANVPMGTIMPTFTVRYFAKRGDPFELS